MSSPNTAQQELQIFADRVLSGVSSTRKVGDAIGAPDDNSTSVRRRWGVITTVDSVTGTVDVRLDGVIFPNMRRMAWYQPIIGETVMIEYAGNDPVCIGPIGLSAKNTFAPAKRTIGIETAVYDNRTTAQAYPLVQLNDTTDELRIDVGSNLQLGGPGGYGHIDTYDGRVLRFRVTIHSKDRSFTFLTSDYNDWSLPTDIPATTTIPKDTYALGVARYSLPDKKWCIETFRGPYTRYNFSRPKIEQFWGKSGIGTSVALTTGIAATAGQLAILFHGNDWGYWGEMKPPSGTIPAAGWTFIGGGGTDFSSHVNCWAGIVPAGVTSSFLAVVNQATSVAHTFFLYIVSNVQFPKASQYKFLTNAAAVTSHYTSTLANSIIPAAADSLMLNAWSYQDYSTVSGYYGGIYNTDTSTGANVVNVSATDANGQYTTGATASRYIDTVASSGDVYTITANSTPSSMGSLMLQGA